VISEGGTGQSVSGSGQFNTSGTGAPRPDFPIVRCGCWCYPTNVEVSIQTATGGARKFAWGRLLVLFVFGLMLAGFGVAFIFAGREALDQRSYDLTWRESRGVFIGVGEMQGHSSSGVAHFRGAKAVRLGAGYILWGALLALWGALIIRSGFRPSKMEATAPARPHGIGLMLGILSCAMLLGAQVCFFPPWQIAGVVFWSVVVGMPVIIGLLLRAGKGKWTGIPFIALVILAIAIPVPGISFAIGVGVFGTVFSLAHLLFLFPELVSSLETNAAHPTEQNAPSKD